MKDLSKTKLQLKEAVGSKGPSFVIKSLRNLLPIESPKHNVLIALENDFKNYKLDKIGGLLSHEQDMLQLARLRKRILDLLDGLEKEDFDKKTRRSRLSPDNKIRKGHVLYQIPEEMKLHVETRCLVRIAFDREMILEDLDLDDDNLSLKSDLRISDYMRVEIKDPRENPVFDIRSTSESVQFIDEDDFTEWRFYIKPLEVGEHRLELKVSVIQRINGEDRIREKTLDESVVIITEEPAIAQTDLPWKKDNESLVMPCAIDMIAPTRSSRSFGALQTAALSLALLIGFTSVTYAYGPEAIRHQMDIINTFHIQDNEESYTRFIEKYPKSKKREEATYKKIVAIERDDKNDKEKLEEALTVYVDEYGPVGDYAENAFWKLAELSQLPEDYLSYSNLEGTPPNEAKAIQKVAQLETKVWAEVQQNKTAINLDRYLRIYPNGSQRTTAIAELANVETWADTTTAVMPKRLKEATLGLEKRLQDYAQETQEPAVKQALLERSNEIKKVTEDVESVITNEPQDATVPDDPKTQEQVVVEPSTKTTTSSPCPDQDRDGICDDKDNCPEIANANQANSDNDALGDACDECKTKIGPIDNKGCPVENSTSVIPEMVRITGGTFEMGNNEGEEDEKPVHSVTVSSFYMAKYEVTQKMWRSVMGEDPEKLEFKGCDDCPVESVSWNDIQTFLTSLNQQQPGKNYRLPTEAEWEYAAKGGHHKSNYQYAGSDDINEMAWYRGNSNNKTHPVGQKKANALGLYDMTGNVYEWCSDWYDSAYYAKSSSQNPKGADSGSGRVGRGGGWILGAEGCRVANRNGWGPEFRNAGIGFRLAHSL